MSKQSAKQKQGRSTLIWWVAGAALVAALGLIGASLWSTPKAAPVAGGDRNTQGKATAKVTVTEYGDYL